MEPRIKIFEMIRKSREIERRERVGGGGKGETGKEGKKEVRRERWKGGVIDTEAPARFFYHTSVFFLLGKVSQRYSCLQPA